MKVLDDVCDILEDELKEIVRNGEMTPQVLDNTYKAVDIIKDITTIKAMKESEYGGNSYTGGSYIPYYSGDDYSMARGRRNDMTRRMYDPTYHNGYSREDDKEHLMKQMEEMKRQLDSMK